MVAQGVDLPVFLYWIGVVVVTGVHLVWEAVYVRRGAEPNRDFGALIGREIGDMVGFTPMNASGDRYESTKPYIAWAAHYRQVGITLILALVVGAAIYWSTPPN